MKNFTSPGKYSKKYHQTPRERLELLQTMYNSQNGSIIDDNLKLNMQNWHDEIKQIVELNPELNPVCLIHYDLFNASS